MYCVLCGHVGSDLSEAAHDMPSIGLLLYNLRWSWCCLLESRSRWWQLLPVGAERENVGPSARAGPHTPGRRIKLHGPIWKVFERRPESLRRRRLRPATFATSSAHLQVAVRPSLPASRLSQTGPSPCSLWSDAPHSPRQHRRLLSSPSEPPADATRGRRYGARRKPPDPGCGAP